MSLRVPNLGTPDTHEPMENFLDDLHGNHSVEFSVADP